MRKPLLSLGLIVIFIGVIFAFSGSVHLVAPANNSFTNNSFPKFNFYFTDSVNQTAPCSLYIDSSKEAENSTVFNNTVTVLSPTNSLTNGPHEWFISCDSTNSEERLLTIDQVDPVVKWLRPQDSNDSLIQIIPKNITYLMKIRVNGTFSPWDRLTVNISDCGGYLADESDWNITKIDETTSDVEIEWNTSDTKEGLCYLFATANDSVGFVGDDTVEVSIVELSICTFKFFSITNVDVRPDVPTTNDNLTCHWNASILVLQREGSNDTINYTANVTWFKNHVRQTNWDVNNILCDKDKECSSPIPVPSSATNENETWTCQVTGAYENHTDSRNGTEVIGNYSLLDLGDIPDPVVVGNDVLFWADYENYGGFDIYPGSCNITAFSITKGMTYILGNSRYEAVLNAPTVGTHTWNVSCSAPLYVPQEGSSTITVNPPSGNGGNGGGGGGGGGRDGDEIPDNGTPVVKLISPIDGSTVEGPRPDFKFYVNDDQDDKLECVLYISSLKIPGLVFDVNGSVPVDTISGLKPNINLTKDIYNWWVSCKDASGNTETTDTWFFILELPINLTGMEELEMNVTAPGPLLGGAIIDFFKTTTPWLGILGLVLLILIWLFFKKISEKEEGELEE